MVKISLRKMIPWRQGDDAEIPLVVDSIFAFMLWD